MVIRLISKINEFLKDNQEKFDSGNFNANFVNQIYSYSNMHLSNQSKVRLDNINNFLLENHSDSFILENNKIKNIEFTPFIQNILYYTISKKEFDNIQKMNLWDIINIIFNKLKNNSTRAVHPFVMSLFYPYFNFLGINYKYIESDQVIELRCDKIENIRCQIQESFKIIDKLFNDKQLKNLSPSLYQNLKSYDSIKIEEYVSGTNNFIDLVLKIDSKKKIYIEINEKHHNLSADNIRSANIYIKNNTLPIHFYKEDCSINKCIRNLWREIAFALNETNTSDSIVIYLVKVDEMNNLPFIKHMVNIQINIFDKGLGIKVKEVVEYLKSRNFQKSNLKKWINKLLKIGDITLDDFHHIPTMIKDVSFKELELNDILDFEFNFYGFQKLFMKTSNEFWSFANESSQLYSKFMKNYLNLINNIMKGQLDRIAILKQNYKFTNNLNQINEFEYNMTKMLIKKNLREIKNELNYDLHPSIWFLKRVNDSYVTLKNIEKKLGKNMLNLIKIDLPNTSYKINDYELLSSEDVINVQRIVENNLHNSQMENKKDYGLKNIELF